MGLAKAWLGAVAVTAVGIALYFALLHSPRPTRSSAAASKDVSETHTRGVSEVAQDGSAILTKDQLALHDGSDSSLPIYLAIVGEIYDVSKGRKHYGPGGGYSFFAGRDASKAYVTGEFQGAGLTDNLDGMSTKEVGGVEDWRLFFADHAEYTYVGKLAGHFYDLDGKPTQALTKYKEMIAENTRVKRAEDDMKAKYPLCNTKWDAKSGTKAWCTNKSGGTARSWAGYPRQLYSRASQSTRCACVQDPHDPNPDLKEYEGCPTMSAECPIKAGKK